ncbi:heavy metal translocating P-type ATPase [Candidatus Desulfovibrio trichonymphae]|uniref:Copper-exporting ATPase n=1 Tax=Candidatus Desulfovibrio trichonymphae TaxID=1725232 RepID=A0A1J1DX74_9BACT|nr:heavy metal translocating P-type ATPase [Candidatus Desulfovibrio trichonymphae]BAV91694.1 copper-exporting ATPase [Candidatus Desulfovibrio trichonymphae]
MDKKTAPPLRFDIGGMRCAACSARIERVLGRADGIAKVSVNLAAATALVWPVPGQEEAVAGIVPECAAKLGFSAAQVAEDENSDAREAFAASEIKAREDARRALTRLCCMAIFAVPLFVLSMGHMLGLALPARLDPHHAPAAFMLVQLVLTLPVVWLGRHFYLTGFAALVHRAPTMDSLVALSTGAAFLFSLVNTAGGLFGQDAGARAMNLYYESGTVLLTMIEFGRFLEMAARRKAADAIGALIRLAPDTALRLDPDDAGAPPVEIAAHEVRAGDMLLVRPGSRIPVDGVVLAGRSAIDFSLLTGESVPVSVAPEDKLAGGGVNGAGVLTMRAEKVGGQTQLAHIIRLVRKAQGSKAPIARLADRASYYFVPFVMLFALLAALAWLVFSNEPYSTAFTVFVAVLVMACPCAMGLATPMSIMVGTGRGAQIGILIKNGAVLETACRVTVLAVDKTGTLTMGRPALVGFYPPDNAAFAADGISENVCLALAAALEGRSEHPLALALVNAARRRECPPGCVKNAEVFPGFGIHGTVVLNGRAYMTAVGSTAFMSGRAVSLPGSAAGLLARMAEAGQTPLVLALGQGGQGTNLRFAGIFALEDTLRPESAFVVQKLRDMGVRVLMLTGDNEHTARAVAAKAGVDEIMAGILPDGKAAIVRRLQAEGEIVGMVGDGVNDAPALAAAHVGMALGTGTDVSAEAGDIVLMRGGIGAVLSAVALSRAVMWNIKENLCWAFGYNILGLPVAAGLLHVFGGPMLSPMLAGTAMALSSFSVVMNALRLRFFRSSV